MDYGVRVLRFADYAVTPWRNGGGVTREVAASAVPLASTQPDPGGHLPVAPVPTPAWRISMATIDAEAPFSSFPGMRRMLGVVDGDGLELTVAGRMSRLRRGETFGPFAGEASASARPLGAPPLGHSSLDHWPLDRSSLDDSPLDDSRPASAALDVGLIFDPARTRAELIAIDAGERDIVGLIWFVVSLVDGLKVSLNGSLAATLAHGDTAALDLRTGPIARLSLSVRAPHEPLPPSDAAHADPRDSLDAAATVPRPLSPSPTPGARALASSAASAPVAYLISIAP